MKHLHKNNFVRFLMAQSAYVAYRVYSLLVNRRYFASLVFKLFCLVFDHECDVGSFLVFLSF